MKEMRRAERRAHVGRAFPKGQSCFTVTGMRRPPRGGEVHLRYSLA
jgi:hypothetical protein